MKRILSMILALCLIVGLLPAVAMPHAHAETGAKLDADYVLNFGHVGGVSKKYTLTNYDTAIYFKNTTLESGAIRETTTGAGEKDWNAKLIWHTGDEGPTLYLDGFIFDYYDEDNETYLKSSVIALNASANGKPLTIVLQGNDSEFKTSTGGVYNNAPITIRSEGGAKLTGYVGNYLFRNVAGGVNINANLKATITSYSGGDRGGITSTNGDINITGGTVDITTINNASARPIVVCTSGNVNISGGANVTLKNSKGGYSVYGYSTTVKPVVTVNNANLTMYGQNYSGAAPILAEGFCATLKQGASAEAAEAAGPVEAFTASQKYYAVIRNHDNLTKHPATEAQPGIAGNELYYSCAKCGKYFADAKGAEEIEEGSWIIEALPEETQPACEHVNINTTEEPIEAATCTKEGSKKVIKTCADCGEKVSEETVAINALGHTEEPIPGKDATCTEAGLTEGKKCTVCGVTTVEQEEINALGHKEETIPGKECTCTETGLTEGKKCTVCGEITVKQEVISEKGHTEKVIPGKDATCTEAGLTDGVECSVCGDILTAQTEIKALGHKEETIAGKDATCTETGLTEGKKCTVCGETTVAQEEIKALGHTEKTTTDTKDATCTEAGFVKTTVTCEVCGETLSETTEEIKAKGHTEEPIPGKDATCTEAGLTEGKKCSVCGETTVAQEEIKALGHTAAEAVVENFKDSDLNNKGSYDSVVYCSVCNAELSRETFEIPVKEGAVAEANGVKYATLAEAVAAGGEVKLLDNLTVDFLIKVVNGQEMILNLNGYTLTAKDGRLFVVSVEVGGKLTINGEGGIINNNAYGYAIVNKGELIVNGGDIVGDYALYNGDFSLTAKATLNGGTFSANEGAFYSIANCSELIVNGATLNDWVNTSAKFTVESGKIENLYVGVADKAVASGVATAINGGEVEALEVEDLAKNPVTKGNAAIVEAPEDYKWVGGVLTAKTYVAEVGDAKYETLAEAVAAGGEVKLLADVVLEDTLTIAADKTVILNLNGYSISQVKACAGSYEMILNKGNLTITGNGKISFTDTGAGDPNFNWGSYTIRNEGNLVVENGTIENLSAQNPVSGKVVHMYCAIFQYCGSSTINGGTISTPTYRSVRLWKGDMTINGGTFEGQVWIQAVDSTAKMTITGGTFAPRGVDGSSVFVGNIDDNGNLHSVEFKVTGGTFTTKIGANDVASLNGPITGGTFTAAAKQNTNAGLLNTEYEFVENADGSYCVEKHVHTEETISGKDATCTANGLTEGKKCATCGEILEAQEEIKALGHTEKTTTETKDATCTEAGFVKTTVTCEICGETISETTEEIKALGHTEKTTTETKDATCTEAGFVKTTVTCEICGETISETVEPIEKLDHTEVTIPGKDATCTASGLTEGKKCSACGEILVAQKKIPALGHSYADDEATECSVCGAARATITITGNDVCVNANGTTVKQVHVFYLESLDGIDINDWSQLKEKAFRFRSITKTEFTLENGTYVLWVEFADADSKAHSASYDVTIAHNPAQPQVTATGNTVFVSGANIKQVHVFYLESLDGIDINNWSLLKEKAFRFRSITKTEFTLENGTYVLWIECIDANGKAYSNSCDFTVKHNPAQPKVDAVGNKVTVSDANIKQIHVFNITGLDVGKLNINMWSELKGIAIGFRSPTKNQFTLASGTHVVWVECVDAYGNAYNYSQVVTV